MGNCSNRKKRFYVIVESKSTVEQSMKIHTEKTTEASKLLLFSYKKSNLHLLSFSSSLPPLNINASTTIQLAGPKQNSAMQTKCSEIVAGIFFRAAGARTISCPFSFSRLRFWAGAKQSSKTKRERERDSLDATANFRDRSPLS